MGRYVFISAESCDAKQLLAAKRVAKSHGATVVKSLAGTMLLEVASTKLPELARALPGWSYSVERKTARIPERKPLEHARTAGTAGPRR